MINSLSESCLLIFWSSATSDLHLTKTYYSVSINNFDAALLFSVTVCVNNFIVTPWVSSLHYDERCVIIVSKVLSLSKLRKDRYCQCMLIFRLPSNWLLFMTRIIQKGVGALCTDQMLIYLCLFQRRACVCLLALGEVQPLEAITFPLGQLAYLMNWSYIKRFVLYSRWKQTIEVVVKVLSQMFNCYWWFQRSVIMIAQ